jgi:hypothetical protein
VAAVAVLTACGGGPCQDGAPGIGAMRGVPDVAGDASSPTGMALAFSALTGRGDPGARRLARREHARRGAGTE